MSIHHVSVPIAYGLPLCFRMPLLSVSLALLCVAYMSSLHAPPDISSQEDVWKPFIWPRRTHALKRAGSLPEFAPDDMGGQEDVVMEELVEKKDMLGTNNVCSHVCSRCRQTMQMRVSALCAAQCYTGGKAFMACLSMYHLSQKATHN